MKKTVETVRDDLLYSRFVYRINPVENHCYEMKSYSIYVITVITYDSQSILAAWWCNYSAVYKEI